MSAVDDLLYQKYGIKPDQQSGDSQNQSGSAVDQLLYNKYGITPQQSQNQAQPAPIQPAAPQPSFMDSINNWANSPTGYEQSTGSDGNNSGLSILGNAAGNFLKGGVKAVTGLAKLGGYGTVGAGEHLYDYVMGQDHSQQWDGEKVLDGTGRGIKQLASQVLPYAQNAWNNPQDALYNAAKSTYEDPFGALMMATGPVDAIGSGLKIAGGFAERGAASAALEAGGDVAKTLAPEVIAQPGSLQSLFNKIGFDPTVPQTLGGFGSQLSSGANLLNPLSTGLKATTAVKDATGLGISKLVGVINGTGSDGATALSNIASGSSNPLGAAAIQGMRTGKNTIGNDALAQAIGKDLPDGSSIPSSIGTKLSDATGSPLFDMTPIQTAATATARNFGMSPITATPEEMQLANEYLYPTAGVSSDGITNDAKDLYAKYDLGKSLVLGKKSTLEPVAQGMQSLIGNNGYIGLDTSGSSLPVDARKNISDLMDQIFKTGDQPGSVFESSAHKMQQLKNLGSNIYDTSHGDGATQKAAVDLKEPIDNSLKQFPEYQNATQLQSAGHGGQKLSPLLPQNNYLKGTDAAVAAILAHFINPSAALGVLASSPRLGGEAANLYGMGARIYGAATLPATTAARYSSISSLLNLLSQNQQQ